MNDDERKSSRTQDGCAEQPLCIHRRTVMVAGATVAIVAPGLSMPAAARTRAAYPRMPIARLSDLREGEPVAFNYPQEEQPNMLVKLGVPAQGGVGPQRDVVAFSILCTHMGGSLRGRYHHDFKAMGPCPFHFSTFDLTKGGTPVHASATQNLPQIRLTTEGDQIFAVGVNGLIYGYRDNLADGSPVLQKA